jgi:hypothetical protein
VGFVALIDVGVRLAEGLGVRALGLGAHITTGVLFGAGFGVEFPIILPLLF